MRGDISIEPCLSFFALLFASWNGDFFESTAGFFDSLNCALAGKLSFEFNLSVKFAAGDNFYLGV